MVKVTAIVLALMAFLVCLVGPLCLYAIALGAGIDDQVPANAVWFVVLGGAVGAGVSYLVFRFVLTRFGRVSGAEADAMWEGRRRGDT